MLRNILYTFIAFFICVPLNAQDIKIADSLRFIYKNGNYPDSLELKIIDNIAFNLIHPDEIISYGKILLEKAKTNKNTAFILVAYQHIGDGHRLKGDYDLAFENYFKGLKYAEDIKSEKSIGSFNCTIADTYAGTGDFKNAQLFYANCINKLKPLEDDLQLAIALLNAGDNFLNQNKSDSALTYFNKASSIFNKEKYTPGQAYTLGNTGLVYAQKGEYEMAERALKSAVKILEGLGDVYAISDYLNHIADIYIEKEEIWLALEYANISYEHAHQMGFKEQLRDASLRLSKIYELMNKSGKALDYLKIYITYKDSLKSESIIHSMAELRKDYELDHLKKQQNRNVEKELASHKIEEPKFYALILGVNDYKTNDEKLEDLDKPIHDAEKLYSTLSENYSFNPEHMILVKDPSRADIINSLEALSATISERDNLLIFYAGHGVWDDNLGMGYWLPSDATSTSKSNWISNSTVRDYISGLKTKHTLLISDACFSGGIFKTRALATGGIDEYGFWKLYKLPSRKAMTSGTLNTVPDDSEFMKYLIKRLTENPEEYLTARQLFAQIETAILNNTNNVPQYGTIQNAGDEGGEFIFIKKGSYSRD